MSDPQPAEMEIQPAAASRQAAALDLVFSDLSPSVRASQVAGLLGAERSGKLSLGGLLEARREGRLVGAIWAQVQAGGGAGVWPPRIVEGESESTADALLREAIAKLQRSDVNIAQALLPLDADDDRRRLTAAGFQHLADLDYLISLGRSFPTTPPQGLKFESVTTAGEARLAQVVEQTYQGTLDCPQLNGVRRIDEVLQEYRAVGVYDPARWFVVQHNGADVGCLILADHPEVPQWELVYMGIVPEARGRGYGQLIVRHAQWLAGQAGRDRLALAVDSRNAPAMNVYTSAGFVAWEHRRALLRMF